MRYLFILVVLAFSLSCQKEEESYKSSNPPLVVIKGYVFRNDVGQDMAWIGNPDINTGYPQNADQHDLALLVYPNPSKEVMNILIFEREPVDSTRIWIVPATYTEQGNTQTSFLGTPQLPSSCPIFDTTLMTSVGYRLQIKNLPLGYYRIYMKTNSILLWDNLAIANSLPFNYYP